MKHFQLIAIIITLCQHSDIYAQTKSTLDEKAFVNILKPLYIDGNGGKGDNLLWYSMISKFKQNSATGQNVSADDIRGYQITFCNASIIGLSRLLYGKQGKDGVTNFFPLSQTELRVKDKTRFLEYVDKKPQYQNFYTYQLISKEPITKERLKRIMLADIERYFDINISWEKQKKKCLVLAAADTSLINYKEGKKIHSYDQVDNRYLVVNNMSVTELIDFFTVYTQYYYSPYPIVDETGLKGNLGHIEASFRDKGFTDHEAFDKALQKYKMSFTLQEREVDVMVITEEETLPELR